MIATITAVSEVTDAQLRILRGERTNEVGLYVARWKGGERWFAVNLLDAEESNIQPRDAVQVGSQVVEATPVLGRPWETWRWIALAALVLLLLEWLFYNKRYFAF